MYLSICYVSAVQVIKFKRVGNWSLVCLGSLMANDGVGLTNVSTLSICRTSLAWIPGCYHQQCAIGRGPIKLSITWSCSLHIPSATLSRQDWFWITFYGMCCTDQTEICFELVDNVFIGEIVKLLYHALWVWCFCCIITQSTTFFIDLTSSFCSQSAPGWFI